MSIEAQTPVETIDSKVIDIENRLRKLKGIDPGIIVLNNISKF